MTLREKYYKMAKESASKNTTKKTSCEKTHMIAVEKYVTQKAEANSNLGYFFCTFVIYPAHPPILSDGSKLSLNDIKKFANSPETDLTLQHYYIKALDCHFITLFWEPRVNS